MNLAGQFVERAAARMAQFDEANWIPTREFCVAALLSGMVMGVDFAVEHPEVLNLDLSARQALANRTMPQAEG